MRDANVVSTAASIHFLVRDKAIGFLVRDRAHRVLPDSRTGAARQSDDSARMHDLPEGPPTAIPPPSRCVSQGHAVGSRAATARPPAWRRADRSVERAAGLVQSGERVLGRLVLARA